MHFSFRRYLNKYTLDGIQSYSLHFWKYFFLKIIFIFVVAIQIFLELHK